MTDKFKTISITECGSHCQKWTQETPHKPFLTPDAFSKYGVGDHNYCRNPAPELHERPFCYTLDGYVIEYCDITNIQSCDKSVEKSDAKSTSDKDGSETSTAGAAAGVWFLWRVQGRRD